MNIAFLSTYPPRECGLATFTQDLVMQLGRMHPAGRSGIIAVSNESLRYDDNVIMYGDKILGGTTFRKFGAHFPLLIKIIDANENLSVQVHPGDAYARSNGEKNGKNELWYVLEARENAEIVYGLKQAETKEEFIKAVSENNIAQTLNMPSEQFSTIQT